MCQKNLNGGTISLFLISDLAVGDSEGENDRFFYDGFGKVIARDYVMLFFTSIGSRFIE